MKTLIRSDSSSKIGCGHIMRDLVFAKTLQSEIIFACQSLNGHCMRLIPYPIETLHSNDLQELIALILRLNIDLLVIDHYEIDAFDEYTIKKETGVKILSFDDTYKAHCCDILINPNIYAAKEPYASLVPKECELHYKSPLIRDEFILEKTIKRPKIYDVCIVMGATDAANLSLEIVKLLPDSLAIAILTTRFNAHLKELLNYVNTKPHIHLYVDISPIAPILNQSKKIILTPSSIVQEVLFLGISFIAIQVASNQQYMRSYLENNGYAVLKEWDASLFMQLYNAF